MKRHMWPMFRSFWFHPGRAQPANDNRSCLMAATGDNRVQALARNLAHRLDRARFMSAWTQVGR